MASCERELQRMIFVHSEVTMLGGEHSQLPSLSNHGPSFRAANTSTASSQLGVKDAQSQQDDFRLLDRQGCSLAGVNITVHSLFGANTSTTPRKHQYE